MDNSGYAGVTRVVRNGGSARMDGDTLVIENASSVMLLTRIEYFPDYSEDKVEALRQAVERTHARTMRRCWSGPARSSRKCSTASPWISAAPRNMACPPRNFCPISGRARAIRRAFLEKMFEMCRYWFILTSGKYLQHVGRDQRQHQPADRRPVPAGRSPRRHGSLLQLDGEPGPGLPHQRQEHFRHARHHVFPHAEQRSRASKPCTTTPVRPDGKSGRIPTGFPPDGWCVRPFWDHYLVTGDLDFLRKRVVPAYKDLALFYEDFLTVTDKNGNYIFVPSFSPENNPGNLDPSCMLVINATMDIAVCREVLTNLIQACETLGIEADSVPKWKAMLAKMPPYLLEPDGTLKEWAWPTLQERYTHRHVSHLYGAWPGDEIDPDRTPQLAKAALIADRRTFAFRACGWPLMAAAIALWLGRGSKTTIMVDIELRQLIEARLRQHRRSGVRTIPMPGRCRMRKAEFPRS